MESTIKCNPNNYVAIICELNDNYNNTFVIVPKEIALGKLDKNGLFQSENEEYLVQNVEDYIAYSNEKKYYAFLITLDELRQRYPDIKETSMLMITYFKEIASKLNILLVDKEKTTIFTTSYEAISPNIGGELSKKIVEADKKQETPVIIEKKDNDLTRIDNFDLENYLKERIFENDSILEDIATTIAMNYRATKKDEVESMLSVGPTGSGKTETYRLIAEYLNVPLTIYDCNLLTSAGYVGKDIDDVLKEVMINSDKDKAKAEKSILVFDEVDKIASRGLDVKDLAVQYLLLKVMDGNSYTFQMEKNGRSYTIDTSFMTVAALGAFSDLYASKEKKSNMGFNARVGEEQISITPDDLIEYGMLAELIGRFYLTHEYKKLNKDDLRRILLTSKTSPLLRKKERLKREFGYDLSWEDEAIDFIIEEAIKKGAGGRSLAKLIAYSFKKIDRELLRREKSEIIVPSKKLVLTADTIMDNRNFKI